MRFLPLVLSAALLTGGAQRALAQLVEVTLKGEVEFNLASSGPLSAVPAGQAVELTFRLDAADFLDSVSFNTRAYRIQNSSFALDLGAGVATLQNPFPAGQTPRFVLRESDPVADGFFLSLGTDNPVSVPLNLPGAFGQFGMQFNVSYTGNTLTTLDVLDAVGLYDFTGLTVFGMTITDGPFDVVGMIFESLEIASASVGTVINEVRIGQPGPDGEHYFELRGHAGNSLDGLTYLVIGDDAGDNTGRIEEAVDLAGSSIPSSSYFVAAQPGFSLGSADKTVSLNFEDGDNVTHLLVSGFTGTLGDDLDTNDDGSLDSMPWSLLVDSLGLSHPGGNSLLYSENIAGPNGSAEIAHAFRESDGTGSLVHFGLGHPLVTLPDSLDTPGAANSAFGTLFTSAGGGTGFKLDAGPARAGNVYLTVFGVSGTSPGTPLAPGLTLPLNVDALTLFSLNAASGPVFVNTLGLLDGAGKSALQRFMTAPVGSGLVGITMVGASVVFEPIGFDAVFVSNSIALKFL